MVFWGYFVGIQGCLGEFVGIWEYLGGIMYHLYLFLLGMAVQSFVLEILMNVDFFNCA